MSIALLLASGVSTKAPAFVIVVPLEGGPSVYVHALSEGEEQRLYDWVESVPSIAELLGHAYVVQRDWRRS